MTEWPDVWMTEWHVSYNLKLFVIDAGHEPQGFLLDMLANRDVCSRLQRFHDSEA